MKQVNVHEAKSSLSKLLRLAEKGERVLIARSGKPVAELKVLSPKQAGARKKRAFGGWEEQKEMFDALEKVDLSEAWQEFWNEDLLNP
ncbi:MAG TPA: type II toxin-antitoxin system prevent-host-death family antitoxin [Planctomycetota bacterium]|nr:type II toxin-antitoxin system prevent-host-death family antitoxin [Planctomycetota bacterium]